MAVGIGAGGVMGLAIETSSGTYEAPTKFFPIQSENLQWVQSTVWRRVIRGTADVIGAVPGNGHVEGTVTMECLEDVLPYFLSAARGTLEQTGTTPDFEYTFTPSSDATPSDTLSITVVRNDVVFGYVGVVVASMTFTVDDDGMLTMSISLLGQEEDEESGPTHSFDGDAPFGAGTYDLHIPADAQDPVEDTDDLTLEINDGAEVQNRLIGRRGAAFVSYGERQVTLSVMRDFESRTDYDAFKALTAEEISIRAEKRDPDTGALTDRFVEFYLNSAIKDTYEVGLSAVGDLIRATVEYQGTDNDDGDGSYLITIGTEEDLGLGA